MKLKIKKVRIKNFLSVGAVPIQFEYTPGNHAVLGENGVGKSTIFTDAIIFALKGTSLRGLNKEGMINSINGAECEVFLWFSIDGINYRIERGLNPNFLRFINEDEETSNVLQEERASLREAQSEIDAALVVSATSLANLIALNINYSKPFLKLDAADRRQIFLDVMNTAIFGKMLDKARKEYNSAKQDMKVLVAELKAAEENYQTKLETFNKLSTYKQEFEESKAKEINDLTDALSVVKSKHVGLIGKRSSFNIKDALDKLNAVKEKCQTIAIESDTEISSNKRTITEYESKIKRLQSSPVCSECNSPTSEGHALAHINELLESISKLKQSNDQLEERSKSAKDKLKEVREKTTKAEQVEETQRKLEKEISSLEEKIKASEEYIEVVKSKQFEMKNVVTEDDVTRAKLRVVAKKSEIDIKDKEMKFADLARERLGDKGVKSFSIKKIIPALNAKMSEYLAMFNATYTITFDSELNETLKSRRRDQFSYNNFSSGEQKRIDLALMFSLLSIARSRNSIDCNILILDEVLDTSLSSKGTANLMDFMKTEFKRLFPELCVYVVSHKTELNEDNFDTVIKLKKEGEFTKIDSIQKCDTVLQV